MPTLDELVRLFTGDWIHDDHRWDTTPCYDVGLATAIADAADLDTEPALRKLLFGRTPAEEIPWRAQQAITLAVQRHRTTKGLR